MSRSIDTITFLSGMKWDNSKLHCSLSCTMEASTTNKYAKYIPNLSEIKNVDKHTHQRYASREYVITIVRIFESLILNHVNCSTRQIYSISFWISSFHSSLWYTTVWLDTSIHYNILNWHSLTLAHFYSQHFIPPIPVSHLDRACKRRTIEVMPRRQVNNVSDILVYYLLLSLCVKVNL